MTDRTIVTVHIFHRPTLSNIKWRLSPWTRTQLSTVGAVLIDVGDDKSGACDTAMKHHLAMSMEKYQNLNAVEGLGIVIISGDRDFSRDMVQHKTKAPVYLIHSKTASEAFISCATTAFSSELVLRNCPQCTCPLRHLSPTDIDALLGPTAPQPPQQSPRYHATAVTTMPQRPPIHDSASIHSPPSPQRIGSSVHRPGRHDQGIIKSLIWVFIIGINPSRHSPDFMCLARLFPIDLQEN